MGYDVIATVVPASSPCMLILMRYTFAGLLVVFYEVTIPAGTEETPVSVGTVVRTAAIVLVTFINVCRNNRNNI